MKGLILKDVYLMKTYFKSYASMILFFMVFAVTMKSPVYMVFMGMVMGVSTLFSILSMDESGGFSFSMTMPVTRKQVVQGKYLFFAGAMCIVWGTTTVLGLIINLFVKEDVIECIASALMCAAFYLIIMAFIVPVALKWNVQKARYVMLAVVALPCVLIVFLVQHAGKNMSALEMVLDNSFSVVMACVCAAAVGAYMVSYIVSVKIFEKKEF